MPLSISGNAQMMAGRAGVDSATGTTGGVFKFTQPGEFIPMLRNKTSVMRAGATVLPGLTGPVTFPKQGGAATANWVGENPGSDNTASNLITSTVSLAFKTIQASTSVSRQALFSAASGNYALDAIIQNDLAAVIALAIDLAGLNGLGSANQPLGILQDTSVGTAGALGTAGGTMAWTNWVALETAIGDANADDVSALSYITNTKQRGVGKTTAVLGNTASGQPIWQNVPGQMDGVVNGYRAIASNQVPRNLTKGSATTVCSAVIFGAFDQLLIGMFGAGFEVLVDPFSKKNQNMIELTAWNFVDVANRYPTAFATIKDAL
jgi:HK97 family phage major capsid protein